MRVDLSKFIGVPNHKVMDALIDDTLRQAETDPIYFSDLLVNPNESMTLMLALLEDEQPRYRLKVLCNEYGEQVKPGDIVKRKMKRPLVRNGVPTPTATLNAWKAQGIYDMKRYTYRDYIVDDKGCITVPAKDAEYFLGRHGIHSISGMRISPYVQDKSPTKTKDPSDGQKKHVHYWRYKEMTPEMYEELPRISKQEQTKTK